jgi:hypothetical protein
VVTRREKREERRENAAAALCQAKANSIFPANAVGTSAAQITGMKYRYQYSTVPYALHRKRDRFPGAQG